VLEDPEVFQHVGLLINQPPGFSGLLFIESSDFLCGLFYSEPGILQTHFAESLLQRGNSAGSSTKPLALF
jgi:hypothetical protein